MICATCGTNNPADYQFCVSCGASLATPQQEPTEPLENSDAFSSPPRAGVSADTLSGRTLDGKYRLEAKLGAGGMGSVYLATRLHIGDKVAVKVLHGDKNNDRQAGERFRLEAQMAARLKHPNAVGIYDYGVTGDGLRYLVMELIEGQSLRQIIARQGALPLPAVVEITSQACAALGEAHRQNIIHRDIKPDNIIVQDTAAGLRVKVLDFGVAKMLDLSASNLTKTGSTMGTPRYMSPEQCMGEELDARSDIYSLGIVLYEMLCGIVPFTAPSSTGVAVQQVTQPPRPLRQINQYVTPAVEMVVLRALEKKREARPQTANALAQELTAAFHGRAPAQPAFAQTPPSAVAPATNPVAPVPTSGIQQQTMAAMPSLSGDRERLLPSFLQDPARAATTRDPNKNRSLLFLGGGILGLFLLLGLGVFMYALLSGNLKSDTAARGETTRQRGDEGSTDTGNAQRAPFQPPDASAEEELTRLRQRRINATSAQYGELTQALLAAENKYPNDYRFTYERAKLVMNSPEHDKASLPLYEAARKAIRNNQADAMLNDLARDRDGDFRRLSRGHGGWATLEDALRRRDATALPASGQQ